MDSDDRDVRPLDTPPPDNELVIGLVGAVGIDQAQLFASIAVALGRFDYRAHDVHLTDLLHELDWDVELADQPFDERVWSYMTAGNTLRERWDRDDAFALLGITDIARRRAELTGSIDLPDDRQAFVVRSLKRPEEVQLLREVYGSRFVLIAAFSPTSQRRASLERRIAESRVPPFSADPGHSADELMKRDEAEGVPHGQALRRTFHLADFFIDASDPARTVTVEGSEKQVLELELDRTFEILFGHPHRTPSRDEFGMFQAVAAMRRSAELGRQVGAAICTREGDVVAVGANEVPRAGGGLYWEGDADDAREFKAGRDRSDERKAAVAQQILDRLQSADPPLLRDDADAEQALSAISNSDLDNLIEFIRAVHAEMAAITDAARRGIPVADCVLYVTTFPCHHCARHLIASGICRVVYVAPYAKSLAEDLHSDALAVGLAHDAADRRVRFDPFVGVGPSRYLELFAGTNRKRDDGTLVEFDPATAQPRLSDRDPPELRADVLAYLRRERRAEDLLATIQAEREPRFVVA